MFNNFSKGHIILYLGPMFGSKSSALYDEMIRRHYGGQKSIMVKKNNDTRYDKNKIETHDHKYANIMNIKNDEERNLNIYKLNDEIHFSVINCDYLYEINDIISSYDVILIDEIQFFNDAPYYCDLWANNNKTVICAGLIGTYQRTIFDVVAKLIPRSEYIFIKNAICKDTGKTASFSERLVKSNSEILIGGLETYKPVDRITFFNDMEISDYREHLYTEIINFSISINKPLTNEQRKKLKEIINKINKNNKIDYLDIIKNL